MWIIFYIFDIILGYIWGKWVHRLTNIDLINKTATCLECGPVLAPSLGSGKGLRCPVGRRKRPYFKYRKLYCERCGFIPEDICQLDIDHINRNHKNNDPLNLQTLCANCHRLKTKLDQRKGP